MYIYYHAHSEHAQQLQQRVHAMQSALTRQHGVVTALKRRPPHAQKVSDTWMEVYLHIPDDFESVLQTAVSAAMLSSFIDGARHIEYFLDCPSCA